MLIFWVEESLLCLDRGLCRPVLTSWYLQYCVNRVRTRTTAYWYIPVGFSFLILMEHFLKSIGQLKMNLFLFLLWIPAFWVPRYSVLQCSLCWYIVHFFLSFHLCLSQILWRWWYIGCCRLCFHCWCYGVVYILWYLCGSPPPHIIVGSWYTRWLWWLVEWWGTCWYIGARASGFWGSRNKGSCRLNKLGKGWE